MARARLLALWALLLGCGCGAGKPAGKPVRIGRVRLPTMALLYVAEQRQLFAEEGVAVELTDFAAGKDALDAVIRGDLDLATVYETPLVLRRLEGSSVSALTTLHRASRLAGVAGYPSRGIHTAADLKGRKVGVTARTNVDFFLDVTLAEAGVARRELTLVSASQQELLRAFLAGELDAAALWTPNLQVARLKATEPIVELKSDVYLELSTLVGRPDRVSSREHDVIRVLRALHRAEQLISNGEVDLAALLAPLWPELDRAAIQDVLKEACFEVGLSNLLLTVLRQQAAWLEREGLAPQRDVSWRAVLATGPLERAAPETVTLLSGPPGSEEP